MLNEAARKSRNATADREEAKLLFGLRGVGKEALGLEKGGYERRAEGDRRYVIGQNTRWPAVG
jgi:hypothetical protein